MSKKNSKLPPFVALSWELLNSKPYQELKFASGKLLPYLLGKPRLRFDDPNYYESVFTFSYGEAEKLGFARVTFSRSIKDLQAKGFLIKVCAGGLRGDSKSYSKYQLSEGWKSVNNKEKIRKGLSNMAIYRVQSING